MAILIDEKSRVLIQGVTGLEGSRACREMLSYGTKVVAGVTPGKGGQSVEGVKVFNTVREATRAFPEINTSFISVPAQFVRNAAIEAMDCGIPLINILTEHVPVSDCAAIYSISQKSGIRVVGPSSVGIIAPGKAKIGSIGGPAINEIFTAGPVGIISKSGGMTAEIASMLSRAGIGQSTVVGIGGDQIIGSDFSDILELFKDDNQTKAIVIFGEIGGAAEEKMADWILKNKLVKPVVAIIAGKFSEMLPADTALGHAGAIVSRGVGSYSSKIDDLKRAGVHLPPVLDELPDFLRRLL